MRTEKTLLAALLALSLVFLCLPATSADACAVAGCAAQLSADGGTLRIIAAVDSLDYACVGFEISAQGGEVKTLTDKTVYAGVQTDEKTVFSSDFGIGDGFVFVLTVTGIPNETVICAKPFAQTHGGERVYAQNSTITVNNGHIVTGGDGMNHRIQKDDNTQETYNIALDITNPVIDAALADPEIHRFDDTYWIYGTTVGAKNIDAAYSTDNMKTWTLVKDVIDMTTFPWATDKIWAPSLLYKNGLYYITFSNGDSHSTDITRGINIGVSDSPSGPFEALIDRPLVFDHRSDYPDMALIDQDLFMDDDGQVYMYYGGGGHCFAVKLSEDMKEIVQFEDTSVYMEMEGLTNYMEAPFMIKRGGKYYLMYSCGVWSNDSYNVRYAVSDSPVGPFYESRQILKTLDSDHYGPGHHSCIYIEENNQWLICYHIWKTGVSYRRPCIGRLVFNQNGSIRGVDITDHWTTDDDFGPDKNNLALNAAVTDSGYKQYGGGDKQNINDGDIVSYWQFDEMCVTQDGSDEVVNCWIQLDFGSLTEFDTVNIDWENGTMPTQDGFELLISNDGESFTGITDTDMFYDSEPAVGVTKQTFEPVTARYLRVNITRSVATSKWSPKIYEIYVANKAE